MVEGKLLPVHLVGDNDVLRLCYVQAAGIANFAGRDRLLLRGACIAGFKQDLASMWIDSCFLQQSGQRHTGPLGGTDCAQLPLWSPDLRNEEDTPVTGTFESGWLRDTRQGQQLLRADLQRRFYSSVDSELVVVTIQHRSPEVTPNVEQVVGREEFIELVERILEIERIAFADRETDVRLAANSSCAHSSPLLIKMMSATGKAAANESSEHLSTVQQ